MRFRSRLAAVFLSLLVGTVVIHAGACFAEMDNRPDFSTSTAEIVKADGSRIKLDIEVALSPDQQAYGLMFLKHMDAYHGMMFPFSPPQAVSFWMKNTFIPLDLLFIRSGGVLSGIATNTTPNDLTPISSPGEVEAVLEVNGGFAAKHGVRVGDRIESPVLLRP